MTYSASKVATPIIILYIALMITIQTQAQTYACSELSIAKESHGNLKRKSFAVSGLYIKLTPDSIKVFGNYSGRYISNVLIITKTVYDTIYAEGGFFKNGIKIKMVLKNNKLTSDYNFIDDTGETKVSIILTLNPVKNHFSEKHHKQKENEQSQTLRRDLLGREKKE